MKNTFRSFLCAVALGSLTSGAAHGQNAKPDAEGYVRDWLMLAPIPVGQENAGADFIGKDQVEGEASLKPKAGDKAKVQGKEFTWKSVQSKEAIFDFNTTLGEPHENVTGYLVAYLVCEKDMADLALLVGCNDQARIHLNGKEVFIFTETGILEKDTHKVEKLSLTKGVNTLVFKIINENNNWQGCLRFTDKTGKAVTDFTVKLAP